MKNIIKTFTIFSLIFLAQNFGFAATWCSNGLEASETNFTGDVCTLTKSVAKNGQNVFFNFDQNFSGQKILTGADAASFSFLDGDENNQYFEDKNSKYICNIEFGCQKITDSKVFNILRDKKQNLSPFSYDGKNIYFGYQKMLRVDKNTFSVIQGNYGEDKNFLFRGVEKVTKTKIQNICNSLGVKPGGNDLQNISKYENIFKFVPLNTGEQLQYILSGKNLVTKNIGTSIQTGILLQTAQKKLVSKPIANVSSDKYGNKFFKFENGALLIQPAKKIAFDFVSSGSTTKTFMLENNKSFVMNGSYFGYRDGRYFPAGAWFSGEQIEVGQTQPQDDINLRVVVRLDNKNQNLQFFYNDEYNISWEENVNYVNAGPWIFRGGVINDIIFKNYSHRGRETSRTAIISDSNGQIYFFLSPNGMSISSLAQFIEKTNMFYCGFDIVNLDGGSSTAYSSEEGSYNENKKLPIFFSIGK